VDTHEHHIIPLECVDALLHAMSGIRWDLVMHYSKELVSLTASRPGDIQQSLPLVVSEYRGLRRAAPNQIP